MNLLVISSSNNIDSEHIIIKKLLDEGLDTLHVRKPKLSTEGLRKFLDGFAEEYHKHMIIHTHHNLIWDFNLKGLHITKTHKKQKLRMWFEERLYNFRRPGMIRTTSCSSISSLAESYPLYEYILLSPIFVTPQEHRPTFSRSTLDTIMAKFPKKVVARGGANVAHIEKAKEIGFSGIAFHNTIWHSEDPVKSFIELRERYKQLGLWKN